VGGIWNSLEIQATKILEHCKQKWVILAKVQKTNTIRMCTLQVMLVGLSDSSKNCIENYWSRGQSGYTLAKKLHKFCPHSETVHNIGFTCVLD
jgi:hypothetical protein